ncbi:hypothetical protein L9S41_19100 [Geoalkalibacter halelectricus]|uniref:KAP family P-loop domain-containing protein n=1 Tax=Geoalkalibacter halelectricus TaxID=2847045 RepID=A0ABY5ZLN3_9BACT|nr:hypothetical protein [Geoalkalibacter halelectricus]UWZ79764.1 hypothetical protein L9S41_19100 [Geoalkalibacter halelectricus]
MDSLEHHLKEIANSGAKLVIMVDDLDLGWDNSEISNNLLLGLLSASSYMKSVSQNIHVFIFLREDVYSILMEKTQHSDKYRNVERIRWTKDGLISLLNERIRHNYRKNGEKCADHPFEHVFPVTVGTHNTDNWLVERTLSRPRELIQIARFYTEDVEGEEPQDDALKACEAAYSSWKLDDLCTEYSNQYPGLSDIFTYWKTKFFRYKYHLSRADVEEMIFQIFDEVAVNAEWFNELIAKLDFQGFLAILYCQGSALLSRPGVTVIEQFDLRCARFGWLPVPVNSGASSCGMRKAYGFKTLKCLEIALYHELGKLPEPEYHHRFC